MKHDHDLLRDKLEFLWKQIPTAYFMALITIDGVRVAGWMEWYPELYESNDYEEEERIGALSAAMASLSERILTEMQAGLYRYFIVQGETGTIFNIGIGVEAILTFGVREARTIDSVLVILQQHWGELLSLLDVPAPKL